MWAHIVTKQGSIQSLSEIGPIYTQYDMYAQLAIYTQYEMYALSDLLLDWIFTI